jgi:hypothetical protein
MGQQQEPTEGLSESGRNLLPFARGGLSRDEWLSAFNMESKRMKLDTRDTWIAVRELEATIGLITIPDARGLPNATSVLPFFSMQNLDLLID